jgi:hypothetical protein
MGAFLRGAKDHNLYKYLRRAAPASPASPVPQQNNHSSETRGKDVGPFFLCLAVEQLATNSTYDA